jgi:hypothetical protein
MNSETGRDSAIVDFDGLLSEKKRLEELIQCQKNIIRHDFDELKNQFKKEIKPALDTASFVKRIARPETRMETLLMAGSGIAIDFAFKRLFGKSNFLIQMILPKLVKRYAKRFLALRNNRSELTLKQE